MDVELRIDLVVIILQVFSLPFSKDPLLFDQLEDVTGFIQFPHFDLGPCQPKQSQRAYRPPVVLLGDISEHLLRFRKVPLVEITAAQKHIAVIDPLATLFSMDLHGMLVDHFGQLFDSAVHFRKGHRGRSFISVVEHRNDPRIILFVIVPDLFEPLVHAQFGIVIAVVASSGVVVGPVDEGVLVRRTTH